MRECMPMGVQRINAHMYTDATRVYIHTHVHMWREWKHSKLCVPTGMDRINAHVYTDATRVYIHAHVYMWPLWFSLE